LKPILIFVSIFNKMPKYSGFKKIVRRLFKRPIKVGLALGGGSSRGVANAGVLKALVENNIPIDLIAGTSAGAIVGALFAGGIGISDIIKAAKTTDWFTMARVKFNGVWPISGQGVEEFIRKYLGNKRFEDLNIPFSAVATDYRTGEKAVLSKGDLTRAIHASSAIPGVFAPVEYDGRLLMDGLMIDNVPADVAREMGADYVIAVDVVPDVVLTEGPKNVRQLVERAVDIASRNHCRHACYEHADVVIVPVTVDVSPLDFSKSEHLIKLGEQAALKAIGKIRKDLNL